jgi:NAD(P)-dependent dehydrogenase (short-subunit alcohol dehydrogenase family)
VPDRTALVTGGGSGIGRAVAISHFCKGYRLALAGRRIEPLHETARQVAGVPVIQGDHCHEDDAERMISETVAKFRRLNVLVNNAGAIRRNGPGSRDRRAALGWAGAKRPGPFLVARAAIRAMLPPGPADRAIGRSGDRAIVYLHAGTYAGSGVTTYSAAQAGLLVLTRSIAVE